MGDPTEFGRALEGSRKDLLDLTTRNPLLHIARAHGAGSLEIVDELSDHIASILVNEGRVMSFLPAPEPDAPDPAENPAVDPAEHEAFGELGQPLEDAADGHGNGGRQADTLRTSLYDRHLHSKLLSLFYGAETHVEERGVNTLHLALGFLKWYDSPDSHKERFAPLILLPARLVRREVGGRIRLAATGEDLNTNLPLQARLSMDFGIELPDLPDREELVASEYFAAVRQNIRDHPRWEVLDNHMVLGFFSLAEFLLYRDLDLESWPDSDELEEHEILSTLLVDEFESSQTDGELPGDQNTPNDQAIGQAHVLDADSSQTRAIEEVERGRSMVIQGPPGTGKSQTIANLIAGFVTQGKKVLFLAEKRAALDVVHRRLENIGLSGLCLQLASPTATRGQVLAELEKTLAEVDAAGLDGPKHLEDAEDRPSQPTDLLYTRLGRSGLTPYRVLDELARLSTRGVDASILTLNKPLSWTRESFESKFYIVSALCERIQRLGIPIHNPWRGVRLRSALRSGRARQRERLARVSEQIAELEQSTQDMAALLKCDPAATMKEASRMAAVCDLLGKVPAGDLSRLAGNAWREGLPRLRHLLEDGKNYAALREQLESVFRNEAWDWDPRATRELLEEHGQSRARIFGRAYRDARKRFKTASRPTWRGSLPEQLKALQALEKGREIGERIAGANKLGAAAFGSEWKGTASPWTKLESLLTWVERTAHEVGPVDFLRALGQGADPRELRVMAKRIDEQIEACRAGFRFEADFLELHLPMGFGVKTADDIPLETLRERLDEWAQGLDKLPEWIELSQAMRDMHEAGLSTVAQRLFTGDLPAEHFVDLFSFAYYEAVYQAAAEQHPSLATFRDHDHEHLVEILETADRQRIHQARRDVARVHREQIPSASGRLGEWLFLQNEFAKKSGTLPIRKLMGRAGDAIQRIKPVFMMSPGSIAQFLAPGDVEFDLLLIDEASRVASVDAFGAILRSEQVVVVGDQEQLPPTVLFENGGDANEPTPHVPESILSLCTTKGMPSCTFQWHYRSQHESLIAVSNHRFYDNRLCVVPSPYAQAPHLGVKFHPMDHGVFDRDSETNRIEARAVAHAAVVHARSHPQQSLGIATVSLAQRDAILHELEHLWRTEQDVRPFFTSHPDPFFVKNLETIQGDERDVIFISVGYGPDQDGTLPTSFGPLDCEAGARGLNVLMSRARMRCEIFTSMRAKDMDRTRPRGQGVATLLTLLRFAEEGRLSTIKPSPRGRASTLEEEVRLTLRRLGHTVDSRIGREGSPIHIAVRDPKNPHHYVLGVQCDGATNRSDHFAPDLCSQQVLESRGWIIHHIQSTDWFWDRDQESRKLQAAMENAIQVFEQRDRDRAEQRSKPSHPEPNPPTQPVPEPTPAPHLAPPPPQETPKTPEPSPPEPTSKPQPYTCAELDVPTTDHPKTLPVQDMAAFVTKIVNIEGPIHEDEIIRRVTSLWHLPRTSPQIQAAVAHALLHATNAHQVTADGRFYDTPRTGPVPIRSRANVPSPGLRKPEHLPPSEIRAAIHLAIHHQLGADRNNTTRQVSRMLGFKSTSTKLAAVIEEQVEHMVAKGLLSEDRGMLRLVG